MAYFELDAEAVTGSVDTVHGFGDTAIIGTALGGYVYGYDLTGGVLVERGSYNIGGKVRRQHCASDGRVLVPDQSASKVHALTHDGTSFSYKMFLSTTYVPSSVYFDGTYWYVSQGYETRVYTFDGTTLALVKNQAIDVAYDMDCVYGAGGVVFYAGWNRGSNTHLNVQAMTFDGANFTIQDTVFISKATDSTPHFAWAEVQGSVVVCYVTAADDLHVLTYESGTLTHVKTNDAKNYREVWGDSAGNIYAANTTGVRKMTYSAATNTLTTVEDIAAGNTLAMWKGSLGYLFLARGSSDLEAWSNLPDGKMRISASGANPVDVSVPEYPYSTRITMPISTAIVGEGSDAVKTYDPGTAYDLRQCECEVVCIASEADALLDLIRSTMRNVDSPGFTIQMNTDSGFHPFGPDKGDVGPFATQIIVLANEGVGQAPWLYHRVVLLITKNAAAYPAFTPAAQSVEGELSLAGITDLRFPPEWFVAEQVIGLDTVFRPGGRWNEHSTGTDGDEYRSSATFRLFEGNMAAVIAAIVNTYRDGAIPINTPSNSYNWGSDKPDSGLSDMRLTNYTLELTNTRHNEWELPLEMSLIV